MRRHETVQWQSTCIDRAVLENATAFAVNGVLKRLMGDGESEYEQTILGALCHWRSHRLHYSRALSL